MIRMRGVERHRLGDLDQLLLADPQVLDQHVGPDAGLQPVEEFAGAPLLLLVVDVAQAALVISRVAKMFSATVRLPNRLSSWNTMPMPRATASPEEAKRDRLAVEQDAPERRLLDAGDDLHQRRLAGAVLADQHVDRAAAHLEIGALDRDRAGIDLRDVLQLQDDIVARLLMAPARSRLRPASPAAGRCRLPAR